jgi:hypothetical protein
MARRQLRQSSPVGPHPDENLLTAFMEGALGETLRAPVLRHLVACPTCRNVIALSLPELLPAAPQPAALRWFRPRWRSWNWAGALAATAIIVGAAWVGRIGLTTGFHPDSKPAAVAQSLAAPQGKTKDSVSSLPKSTAPASVAALTIAAASRHQDSSIAPRSNPATSSSTTATPDGNMVGTSLAVNGSFDVAPMSSASGAAAQSLPVPASMERISPQVAVNSSAGRPATEGNLKPTKWMVAKTGVLYESFDDGMRWQSVAVPQNASVSSVSATGNEIWAGGAGGALFHSSDAGHSWTQVTLSYNGLTLVDGITQVQFADSNHGSVTTTSGKAWVTADGGETWEIR